MQLALTLLLLLQPSVIHVLDNSTEALIFFRVTGIVASLEPARSFCNHTLQNQEEPAEDMYVLAYTGT